MHLYTQTVDKFKITAWFFGWTFFIGLFLFMGGWWATLTTYAYGAMLWVVLGACLYRLTHLRTFAMGVGVDRQNQRLDMGAYDAYVNDYNNRHSTYMYWSTLIVSLVIFCLFVSTGHLVIPILIPLILILGELERYLVCRCITKNKTSWGASMFIYELQKMVGEVNNEDVIDIEGESRDDGQV